MKSSKFEKRLKSKDNKSSEQRTCAAIFVVFLKCTLEKGFGASNTLINIEVEAIKSEVHLNYPVDTRKEKVGIKSRNQVSRSRRNQEKS